MFGLSIEKIILIAVIAAVVVGPERLPAYSRGLSSGIRKLKAWLDSGKERLESEVGQDIDWRQLNPRQYDPRRIIKNALIPTASEASAAPVPTASAEKSSAEPDNRTYATPSKPRVAGRPTDSRNTPTGTDTNAALAEHETVQPPAADAGNPAKSDTVSVPEQGVTSSNE
ncbi:hypothetical protein D9V32_00310 [Mycetocola tolaasinivorans]|uniref:Sec-independent protein translocase TatB n=1 Tax=Mycetocola tolaasinivorans TaxID=76635 RepID=A0A3L7ACV5_9MICO|nr:twin-arginine translocase TatA/TatE family subunit [Mycetocola tolaasinivorans]RLP77814.1 hypothetical protein D9V32_00310 [Mycetocola tolaasinivorans]